MTLIVTNDDLPISSLSEASSAGFVGCDIETTGLDHFSCEPKLFQMHVGNNSYVVRLGKNKPPNIQFLLYFAGIKKIFHHAVFDLTFLRYHYGLIPNGIICTKVAVKVLDPEHKRSHSLKNLLHDYFAVELDKSLVTSESIPNWDELTAAQLEYAQNDVKYLLPLWNQLKGELKITNKLDKALEAFRLLPHVVELKASHVSDEVFAY